MIKYKCKSLFHFISSTLLLNNINEEWRKMKMNVKNSSQNTVKKYEELNEIKLDKTQQLVSNRSLYKGLF